ncbi:MAG: Response regulatory domain-containing protein [Nitrospira sp.]|nr:MAG: Response regulatory domain-containing protein [Nitrospira sp.]
MPKILVADDSIAVRKVAERLLTEAGLGVTLAANGEEALAYLSKERPDAVVSDVIMPDKSGYEVCAFVRGHASLATTPVLLISGIVNDEVTKQAESCHADGVLKKPFQGTSLKDRVLELLEKRQVPAAASSPVSPAPQPVASGDVWSGPRITDEQLATYKQAVDRVRELDAQVQAERVTAEGLKKRVGELEVLAVQAKELEGQLAVERQLVEATGDQSNRAQALEAELAQERQQSASLKGQIAGSEDLLAAAQAKALALESSLKSEQDSIQSLRQQIADLQQAVSVVPQLESTLTAERAATAKLVEQVTVLEAAVERTKDLEARLANEEHRAADCEQQVQQTEAVVAAERTRVEELSGRLAEAEREVNRLSELERQLAEAIQAGSAKESRIHELEKLVAASQEMETLLATERDRTAVLTRRVSESEQSAEQSMKRFEDMARKLGEIAGLASQLGSGKGRV